jgi:POT family proton-dependent oligopeptide transporter
VLFVTSLPAVEDHSTELAGLAISMILLGLGIGGIKATISPFIGSSFMSIAGQKLHNILTLNRRSVFYYDPTASDDKIR